MPIEIGLLYVDIGYLCQQMRTTSVHFENNRQIIFLRDTATQWQAQAGKQIQHRYTCIGVLLFCEVTSLQSERHPQWPVATLGDVLTSGHKAICTCQQATTIGSVVQPFGAFELNAHVSSNWPRLGEHSLSAVTGKHK